MAVLSLPDISTLPSLPDQSIIDILDLLFEPSTSLHTLVLQPIRSTRELRSYSDLVGVVRFQLLAIQQAAASDPGAKEMLLSILGAHPRLGAKKVESVQSAAEQAQLKALEGSDGTEELAKLNAQYEATFPGLRYVVFVNGRSRNTIMANMRERIARNDFPREEVEAIEAMVDIAKDRAQKLLNATASVRSFG